MISSNSSKAIISKARAKYGCRLRQKDYQNLINCKSVPEIAAYLKSQTVYSNILRSIDEKAIHRGRLETLLREKLFCDLESLCRYKLSSIEHFAQFIISRSFIGQLIHILMLLNSEDKNKNIIPMPKSLFKQTHIDIHALYLANNYNEVLQVLGNTDYGKILERFRPAENTTNIDLPAIENALYTYLYSNVFQIINNHTRGQTKKQLNSIFNNIVDLENYIRIVRLKKRYQSSPEFIRSLLLPFGTIKESTMNAMINAKSHEEANMEIEKTSIGKKIVNMECNYVDELALRFKQKISRHNIRFSTVPVVVMFSYVFLLEVEIINIIHIIEGVRYQIPVEEIKRLLIFTE